MNDCAEREKERDWNADKFPQYKHRLYRLLIEGYCSNVGWVRRLGGVGARNAIYRLPQATKHRREYKADIKTTDRGNVGVVPDAEAVARIAESAMAAHMSVACIRIWPPRWQLEHAASDQDGPVGACRKPKF